MGPSGSGKSTLLDLLALRDKAPAPSTFANLNFPALLPGAFPTPAAAVPTTPHLSGSLSLASSPTAHNTSDGSPSNNPPPPLALDIHLLCDAPPPTTSSTSTTTTGNAGNAAAAAAAAKRTRGLMRAQMGFLDQEHRLPSTLTVRWWWWWWCCVMMIDRIVGRPTP